MTSASTSRLVLLLCLLCPLLGCGPDFAPYWRIEKLRVMAIGADPIVLKEGDTATLEGLVWAPPGQDIAYQWDWCPFQVSPQERYECPITREELIEQLKQGIRAQGEEPPADAVLEALVPPFDLGTQPSAQLSYPLGQEFVLGLCQALQQRIAGLGNELANLVNVGDCSRGFQVTVRLEVSTSQESITSSKRVVLWTGSEFDQNRNPEVEGMEIRLRERGDVEKVASRLPWVSEAEGLAGRWYPIPEDGALPVVRGVPFELRARMNVSLIETWQPPAPQGTDRERDPPEGEVVLYRWFVTEGDLSEDSSLYKEGLNELDKSSLTEFELEGAPAPCIAPAGGEPGCEVTVWSVVRDGRLGVDWLERKVRVIE